MPLQAVEQVRKTENETKSTGEPMPHRLCCVQPASLFTRTHQKSQLHQVPAGCQNIKHISSAANSELNIARLIVS